MKQALIIFVRNPKPGKVKTRIAAAVGDAAAVAIYKKLLQHTHAITQPLMYDKYVFYADGIAEDDLWSIGYYKLLQADADLGTRMQTAFAQLFQKGYQHLCIIGSDCYELSAAMITKAFALLHRYEIVLGPAKDGGYYLLGMRGDMKDIFANVDWSTKKVLKQTTEQIQQHNYSYTLLPKLADVDTINDVPEDWKRELLDNR